MECSLINATNIDVDNEDWLRRMNGELTGADSSLLTAFILMTKTSIHVIY